MRIAAALVLVIASISHAETRVEEIPRSKRTFDIPMHEGVPWPITIAPIDGPLPAAPAWTDPAPAAPTKTAARVVSVIDGIRTSLRESSYQHSTSVRAKDGIYHWDCSGMATWILKRSAPTAWKTLASPRPVARDFATAIERAPTKRSKNGWQRIAKIDDVLPGDVFAWRRPRGLPSKNTGHVGFVVDRPLPVPKIPGAWAVRIADSTSSYHQDDSRTDDDDGGFGIGTLVFITDADGRVTKYGWAGTQTEWYIVTPIVFGRVSR